MNIVNLIDKLPWHPTRRWATRQLSKIDKVIIHQELAEGTIESVNRYHINPNHVSPRGCPRFCYHYGIRKKGEIVQVNELSHIVWHTAGQNASGIGIMLVGNFSGTGHIGTSEPTDAQMESLGELVDYLLEAFNFSYQELFGHYHFGKPACPGTIVQNWIEEKRETISIEGADMSKIPKTIKEIQTRLNKLGYAAGSVDGIKGIKTITAIRKFQADNGLIVDGIVGPNTWKTLVSQTL